MPEKTPHPHLIDGAPSVAGEVEVLTPEEQARAEHAKALGELHKITAAIGAKESGDARVDSAVADYVQEGLLHCGDDTACTKKVLQVGVAEVAQPESQPETAGVIAELLDRGDPSVEEALKTAETAGVNMRPVVKEIDAATAQVEPKRDSGGVRKETRPMALAEQESALSDSFRGLLIPEKNEVGEYGDDVVIELSTRLAEMAIDERLAQSRDYSQSLARIGQDANLMKGIAEQAKLSDDGWLRFGINLAMERIESSVRDYPYKEGGLQMPLPLPPGVVAEPYSLEEQHILDEASKIASYVKSLRAEMGYIPSLPEELVSMRHDKRLSFEDIERFNEKMFRRIPREELTINEVILFSESFAKASPATQWLIDKTIYEYSVDDPRTILALDRYMSIMDDETEDLSAAARRRENFARSVSLDDIPVITKDIDDWLSRGVSMRDIYRMAESDSVSRIHDFNESLKGNEVAKALAMRLTGVEPFVLTDKIIAGLTLATSHEPLLNEVNEAMLMIEDKTPDILASGYPSNQLRDSIDNTLARIGQSSPGGTIDYIRCSLIEAELIGGDYDSLQRTLGDGGVYLVRDEIERGFSIEKSQIDNLISNAVRIHEAMSGMSLSLGNLVDHATTAPGVSRLQQAERFMAVAGHLLENGNLTYMMELLDPHNIPYNRHDIAHKLFSRGMYSGEYGSAEDIMAHLDRAIDQLRILRNEPNLSMINAHALAGALLDGRGSKCTSVEFGEYLVNSDEINSILQMPNGQKNIEESLPFLRRYYGDYDIARARKLLTNPAVESSCGLNHILVSEIELRESEKAQFYDLAEQFLPRLDKDGHPYDSPTTIQRAMRYPGIGKNIDWFIHDASLPLVALPTISDFRAEAVAKGAVDTPRGVYDYLYRNLDRIERMSEKNLRLEVGKLVGYEAADQVIDRARLLAERLKDDVRICVNMRPETLDIISQGDRQIKSLLDLNGERTYRSLTGSVHTSDVAYSLSRSGVEVALGIRSLDENEDHATYGSMVLITGGIPDGANGYGDIMLSFRIDDDLSARTSYTPEDSFHGANRLTLPDAMVLRIIKNACGIGTEQPADYVEAQTVGGISIDKLDKIYVRDAGDVDLIPQSLRHLVQVAPRSDLLYNNSREADVLAGISRIGK